MLITDNAGEELGEEWERVRKTYLMHQRTTEPYSPWQNRAEREIRDLKAHYRRVMHKSKCPERLWDYGMLYTAGLRQRIAKTTCDDRTPWELVGHETPEISEYLDFAFFDWCYFINAGNEGSRTLGRWLGPTYDIGGPYVTTSSKLMAESWQDNQ